MKGEICSSCGAKIPLTSLCPSCGQPTLRASEAERMEWDLQQWRTHQESTERAVAAKATIRAPIGSILPGPPQKAERAAHKTSPTSAGIKRTRQGPKHVVAQVAPAGVATKPKKLKEGRDKKSPTPPVARLKTIFARQARAAAPAGVTIDLTTDEFAYQACVTCGTTGWLLRTGHNAEGTWQYWCVRCSRAFKTPVRIAHGRWPFIGAMSILGGLGLLVNLR